MPKVPNGPSRTGNPSGGGRGNLPPKRFSLMVLLMCVVCNLFAQAPLTYEQTVNAKNPKQDYPTKFICYLSGKGKVVVQMESALTTDEVVSQGVSKKH